MIGGPGGRFAAVDRARPAPSARSRLPSGPAAVLARHAGQLHPAACRVPGDLAQRDPEVLALMFERAAVRRQHTEEGLQPRRGVRRRVVQVDERPDLGRRQPQPIAPQRELQARAVAVGADAVAARPGRGRQAAVLVEADRARGAPWDRGRAPATVCGVGRRRSGCGGPCRYRLGVHGPDFPAPPVMTALGRSVRAGRRAAHPQNCGPGPGGVAAGFAGSLSRRSGARARAACPARARTRAAPSAPRPRTPGCGSFRAGGPARG